MNENFGRYLHKLRTSIKPKKMSQEQVGKIIGTTRQYIDAIEKQKINTSPPRFEQCIKLAEALSPNDDVKLKFLWLAFKERIRNNWDYYEYLHKKEGERPEVGQYDAPIINRRPNTSMIRCKYEIQWLAKTPVTLSENAQIVIDKAITENLSDIKFSLDALSINDTTISMVVSVPTPDSVTDFVEGLKDLTSRTVKNQCTDMTFQAPTIWEAGYLIRTLEYPVEVHIPASAKFEKTKMNA